MELEKKGGKKGKTPPAQKIVAKNCLGSGTQRVASSRFPLLKPRPKVTQ